MGRVEAYVITNDIAGFCSKNAEAVKGMAISRWPEGRWEHRAMYPPLEGCLTGGTRRKMTAGEMGCFAAHMRLWETIARFPHDRLVLVFEGDAEVDPDAVERTMRHEREGVDLVYMAHRLVMDNAAFWTCAYALRRSTAEVLARSFTGAIPADEYLMAACNAGVRAVYMDPQPCRPGKGAFKRSSTEKSPVMPTEAPGTSSGKTFRLLTVGTDPDNAYLNMLLDTAALYGVHVEVLGSGVAWEGGDVSSGPGGGFKLYLVAQRLESMDDDDVVCFVDGYDVLVNSAPQIPECVLRGKVAAGTERHCWPDASLAERYESQGRGPGYLNSGCYMGVVRHVRRVLDSCCRRMHGPGCDDQLAMTLEYLETENIELTDAFLAMNDGVPVENGGFMTRADGTRPFAVHFNGPTKRLLADHYARMFWSPVYGVVYRSPTRPPGGRKRVRVVGGAVSGLERYHDVVESGEEVILRARCGAEEAASLVDAVGDAGRAVTLASRPWAEAGYPLPTYALGESSAWDAGLGEDVTSARLLERGVCPYEVLPPSPEPISSLFSAESLPMYAAEIKPSVYRFPLLSPRFCAWLVERTNRHPWSSGTDHTDPRVVGGYENVPTRDVHVSDLGIDEEWGRIESAAKMASAALYDGYELSRARMAFVVRYDAGATTSHLRPHHDASTLTVNVALNEEYEGGGTWFVRHGAVDRPKTGEAIMHPGRATHKHGARHVTRGTRYVLVAFLE